MATTFQIVDPSDLTTVLFDLNDSTGASNPEGVRTGFGLGGAFALNAPETEFAFVSSPTRPGSRVLNRRDPLVESSFRLRVWHTSSFDSLRSGVNELARLFAKGGVIKWVAHGSSETRYIDFEPSRHPVLFDGKNLELPHLLTLLDAPEGVTIVLSRQPYLRGALIDSDVNLLQNSMLLIDRDANGRPDGWTWDSAADISGEDISPTQEAYSFAIATTGTRNLEQVTPTGSFAEGDLATFSFYAKASAGSIARVTPVVRFLDSGGSALGTEQAGTQVTLTTAWQRITVTTSAAPASTSKARCSLRFANAAATSVTVYANRAQVEEASTASLFRCGTQDISIDPTTSAKGRTVPVYIQGSAPAPVLPRLKMGSGGEGGTVRYASHQSEGLRGGHRVTDYLNRCHLKAADASAHSIISSEVADSGAVGGAGYAETPLRQKVLASGNGTAAAASWDKATEAGSLLIAVVSYASTVSITGTPSGWSNIYTTGVSYWKATLYRITDAGSRSGSEEWTLSGAANWSVLLVELKGVTWETYYGIYGGPSAGALIYSDNNGSNRDDRFFVGIISTLTGAGEHTVTGTSNRGELHSKSNDSYQAHSFWTWNAQDVPSGANVIGQVNYASSYNCNFTVATVPKLTPADEHRYARWEVTTDLESLQGQTFDVIARVRPTGALCFDFGLRWGFDAASQAAILESKVQLDARAQAAFTTWTEVLLGQVTLPEKRLPDALVLELHGEVVAWADAEGDLPWTTGLILGEVYLIPASHTRTVATSSSEETTWYGNELETPVESPAGGTAMTVVGTELDYDTNSDNCGTPTNDGLWLEGWYRFTWKGRYADQSDYPPSLYLRVRNITDATNELSEKVYLPKSEGPTSYVTWSFTRQLELAAGHAYQAQIDDVQSIPTEGDLKVSSIAASVFGVIEPDQTLTFDPEEPSCRLLNSSGEVVADVEVSGPVPDYLESGLNVVYATMLDVPAAGAESPASVLTRTASFGHSYYPRYYT